MGLFDRGNDPQVQTKQRVFSGRDQASPSPPPPPLSGKRSLLPGKREFTPDNDSSTSVFDLSEQRGSLLASGADLVRRFPWLCWLV